MQAQDNDILTATLEEAQKGFDLWYDAPHEYSLEEFWPKVLTGEFSTTVDQAGTEQNCVMVWLSNMDQQHNFNPRFIQTRYTNMVTKMKVSLRMPISELEYRFYRACRERRIAPQKFVRRVAFAKMWHATGERFHQLTELEIKVLSQKLCKMYVELREIDGHIREAMETGHVHPDNHDLNVVRYSVMGLEQLLGNYAHVSQHAADNPNMDMMAMAKSLSADPLAEYLAREAAKQAEMVAGHVHDESAEDDGEDEAVDLERQLMEALESDEADELATQATVQVQTAAQSVDIMAQLDVLMDQMAGIGISDDFAAAMGLLDNLSLQEKAEVLKQNADAIVAGSQ